MIGRYIIEFPAKDKEDKRNFYAVRFGEVEKGTFYGKAGHEYRWERLDLCERCAIEMIEDALRVRKEALIEFRSKGSIELK